MYSTTFSASQFGGSATRLRHILLAAQCMELRKSRGGRYVSGVGEADGNYGCSMKGDRGRGSTNLHSYSKQLCRQSGNLVGSH